MRRVDANPEAGQPKSDESHVRLLMRAAGGNLLKIVTDPLVEISTGPYAGGNRLASIRGVQQPQLPAIDDSKNRGDTTARYVQESPWPDAAVVGPPPMGIETGARAAVEPPSVRVL